MRDKDVLACSPVVDAALIAHTHELNRDYLELIAAQHLVAGSSSDLLQLPAIVIESLARLGDQQRSALARTAYSLYSLGFENIAFWRAIATSAAPAAAAAARYRADADPTHSAFRQITLFAAWHSAVSSPIAARVLYGMPDAVREVLSAAPLWLIRRIAAEHTRLLLPRWPMNPRFWPDLVHFAALNDSRRLAAAQLLGHQLLAMELEKAQGARARVAPG